MEKTGWPGTHSDNENEPFTLQKYHYHGTAVIAISTVLPSSLFTAQSIRISPLMPFDRGRFHPSAEGAKAGITLLVPRPVIDEEQEQILQMILTARVQQLIIHLRRGGIRHLDINEILRRGEFKGYAPLHVCVMRGTSSVVAALLELLALRLARSEGWGEVQCARAAPVQFSSDQLARFRLFHRSSWRGVKVGVTFSAWRRPLRSSGST